MAGGAGTEGVGASGFSGAFTIFGSGVEVAVGGTFVGVGGTFVGVGVGGTFFEPPVGDRVGRGEVGARSQEAEGRRSAEQPHDADGQGPHAIGLQITENPRSRLSGDCKRPPDNP